MTNKEYFEKMFGYDGSIVAEVLPNEIGIGSCGYIDCRESCASRHFPRCPLWWTDEHEFDAINVQTADRMVKWDEID